MKVFVSVGPDDPRAEFCYVPEGELCYEGPVVCASQCGCERALAGVDAMKSTSLVKVVERYLSDGQIEEIVQCVGERTGFGRNVIAEMFESTLAHAAEMEVGDVAMPEFDFAANRWRYEGI